MIKLQEPDATMLPNAIFDYWMSKLSPEEFKLLLALYRHRKNESKLNLKTLIKITGMTRHQVQMAQATLDTSVEWFGGGE